MDAQPDKSWKRLRNLKPTSRSLRRGARKIETATLKHANRFIVSRLDSIRSVRRHALGWLAFVGLLICISAFQLAGYQRSYSLYAPVAGGTYAEGVVGPLESINPIFARTQAEQAASRLVFASLLSYDATTHLRNDLASSWRIEQDGKRYVVDLRNDVVWHDGQKITADDVTFTVNLIKNPLVRSPLHNSWAQVKATKLSETSVAFDLVRPYAAFPHALTFGILPRHILGATPPERLREADFNRQPIGSGGFMFKRIQVINPDEGRMIVYLERNPQFVLGAPKLERFQLHIFNSTEAIKTAFLRQEINGGADLTSDELQSIMDKQQDAIVYHTHILDGVFAFLNNDSSMFSDGAVRKAFVTGTNRNAIIAKLHNYASRLEGPLANSQLSSASSKRQANFDLSAARSILDQAGWKLQGQTRVKDGAALTINLVTIKSGDYPVVAEELKTQWQQLGANVNLKLVTPADVQQTVVLPRAYDAFVYELELGADPDVYAYWHSSQADPRGLNLSNYKSSIASEALSSAQLRLDMAGRIPKYELFVTTWLGDAPAVALYQPQLHYVTSESVDALQSNEAVVNRTDRYRSVQLWAANKSWRYTSP